MYLNELVQNTKEKRNQYDNGTRLVGFYECVRRSLFACRWTGLLPISGLSQPDCWKTRKSWNIPNTLLYAITILVHLAELVPLGYSIFKDDITLNNTSSFMISLIMLLGMLALLPLCNNWDYTMKSINTIERALPPLKKFTVRRINIVVLAVWFAAIVEHLTFQVYEYKLAITCYKVPGDSGLYLKSYASKVFQFNFQHLLTDYVALILLEITLLQSTFIWIFADIMIINVSMYLVDRFQDFNAILNEKEKELSTVNGVSSLHLPWSDLQQHYTRLMKLVMILDQNINPMVFFSYSNLILIGEQLFLLLTSNIIQSESDDCITDEFSVLTLLHYYCTVLVLVMRMSLVSYLASRVHTLSRRPLEQLYTIPQFAYDWSFQRFIDQVFHSNVSLSGLGCFFVTRKMILTVSASLLTYELVLLQYKY